MITLGPSDNFPISVSLTLTTSAKSLWPRQVAYSQVLVRALLVVTEFVLLGPASTPVPLARLPQAWSESASLIPPFPLSGFRAVTPPHPPQGEFLDGFFKAALFSKV